MTDDHTYTMSVELAVVESLGINLYSNAAAVLSELVANAYDADATEVRVNWRQDDGAQTVTVVDNGSGMDVHDVNSKFLVTGYNKREIEGDLSRRWKRPFMGRKGIGKLSVFSIANRVFVYSTKDGNSIGLEIDIHALRERIKKKKAYHPDEKEVPTEFQHSGTAIVLRDLRRKRADLTVSALRKRLARRFDVTSATPPEEGGFEIYINENKVTYADRQELKNLEFIWEFGARTLPREALPNKIVRRTLPNRLPPPYEEWSISGWIGTAKLPSDLTEDPEAGSLKNIIVLARKRPIQEGILEKLDFSRVFGNYVTGQIEADILDQKNEEDIATSDRQRLIEDDPRVLVLQEFLRERLLEASEFWNEERPKRKAKEALSKYPELNTWIEQLPGMQSKVATKMIGTIAALPMEKKNESVDRPALLRAGVLAFARIGLRNTSDELNALSDFSAEGLLALLGAQDEYEKALWADILQSRIDAIKQFQNLTEIDAKEKVLQLHLFDHLWLLDAAWERSTGSERIEEQLHKMDPDYFPKTAKGKKALGRIDIRYRSVGGLHVIVELKRYSRRTNTNVLIEQGEKYRSALAQVLRKRGKKRQRIEVVFVLGRPPKASTMGKFTNEDDAIDYALEAIRGRYKLYDELIENACNQYDEYFEATRDAHNLERLLESLSAQAS